MRCTLFGIEWNMRGTFTFERIGTLEMSVNGTGRDIRGQFGEH